MMIEDTYREPPLKKLGFSNFDKIQENDFVDSLEKKTASNAVIFESKKERIYLGKQLHNNLIQVLSSLNFYVDALKHSKSKGTKANSLFLDNIKDLSEDALKISHDVANSLMSNCLSEDNGLTNILQNLCKKLARRHHLKIKLDLNFKESNLSLDRKHQILKISSEILSHLASTGKIDTFLVKYSLKYKKRILQIDILLKDTLIYISDIEKQDMVGYNNLKHSLDILNVRLSEKIKDNNTLLIVKLPLIR
ncbi:MAG: hypothetical protein L3J45_08805 [Flavobacteriaceae bacterium]|nr:hypothetical protein [Flavobacteriaceae bacterium]